MMKRIIRNRYFLWGTLFLATLVLMVQTWIAGIELFHTIQVDYDLINPAWRWVDSPAGLKFLKRCCFLISCLAITGILFLRNFRAKMLLLPLMLLTVTGGSLVILRSEAVGAESHSWRVIGAANFALFSILLGFPLLAIILIVSGRRRTHLQKKQLSELFDQYKQDEGGKGR